MLELFLNLSVSNFRPVSVILILSADFARPRNLKMQVIGEFISHMHSILGKSVKGEIKESAVSHVAFL